MQNQPQVIYQELSSSINNNIDKQEENQQNLLQNTQVYQDPNNIEKLRNIDLGITKSSNFQASLNLFKGFVGAGILSLPYGFQKTGVLLGIALISFFGFVTYRATIMLMKVCEKLNNKSNLTIKEIFIKSLGQKGYVTYKTFLILYQVGVAIGYEIFFVSFFEIIFGWNNSYTNRILLICLALCILVPMSLIKNYHYYYMFSSIANILQIITIIAIIITYIFFIGNGQIFSQNLKNVPKFNITKIPQISGIIVFAFESIGITIPIRNSMQNPSNFVKIFPITTLIVYSIYIVFSSILCLYSEDKLQSNSIFGLQNQFPIFFVFQAFYAIALAISYQVQLFAAVKAFEELSFIHNFQKKDNFKFIRSYLPQFACMLFTFVIVIKAQNFGAVLGLTGALAGTMIQFVCPILAYLNYFKQKVTTFEKYFYLLLLAITLIFGIFSIWESIMQLFEQN